MALSVHVTRGLFGLLLVCAGFLLVLGCEEESPEQPQVQAQVQALSGEWVYSFVATNPDTCPIVPVPVGCSGGGVLSFVESGTSLRGSYEVRGGCQSCGVAEDYGGSDDLESLQVADGKISFTIMSCRFAALVPKPGDSSVVGNVSCPDYESEGSWRMTRK